MMFVGVKRMAPVSGSVRYGVNKISNLVNDHPAQSPESGELPTYVTVSSGVNIPAYRASQIESLRMEHLNARIRPSVFDIKCKN